MVKTIDTDKFSKTLRERSINPSQRKLLVTSFLGSEQEKDLTEPANCGGYGRIRHFRRETSPGWPANPLPIDPASKALGLGAADLLRAQVFQNASCNWRCWYCYVPFSLLAADPKYSSWLGAADLVELYLRDPSRPNVIDLSGGQPDLVPEWIPWMMAELRSRGLEREVYLWSDDNLSNDYFWQFLSDHERELVASYTNYGKVCCFKGFNRESFAFNTSAAPELFERQFDLLSRYIKMDIDLYCYATFSTPNEDGIHDDIDRFVDDLQNLDPNLPLRVIPLEIRVFHSVANRMEESHHRAMRNQQVAAAAWEEQLAARFTEPERARNIADVPLGKRGSAHR
jgi:uncharacterized Fe-S cluster-containing radical SAM superfamily protein